MIVCEIKHIYASVFNVCGSKTLPTAVILAFDNSVPSLDICY